MLTVGAGRTRLVSTLMDVSRLEAGRLKGSFRRFNLGSVTRDLAVRESTLQSAHIAKGALPRRHRESALPKRTQHADGRLTSAQAKLRYNVECDLTPRDVYVDPDHWVPFPLSQMLKD